MNKPDNHKMFIKSFITTYYKKLILSVFILLIGLIYGFPNIFFSIKLGKNFTPLMLSGPSPIGIDEGYIYAPFVATVLRGDLLSMNTYVDENKVVPNPFFGSSLPALIIAALSYPSQSIEGGFIAADFIFPSIIFVFTFLLCGIFINNFILRLAAAFTTVVMRDITAVLPYPQATINYLLTGEGPQHFLYLSRAFSPQISYAIFICTVYLFFELILKRSSKLTLITGIFIGLLFYTYVFSWSYFLTFYVLVCIYYIAQKDFQTLKSILLTGLIAISIGSLYFVKIYAFSKTSYYSEFLDRTTFPTPLSPVIIRYLLFSILIMLLTWRRSVKFRILFFLVFAGILSPIISRRVLGEDLETLHYLRRILFPVSTFASFVLLDFILIKSKFDTFKVHIIAIIIISITFVFASRIQINSSDALLNSYKVNTGKRQVLDFVKNTYSKSDVIGSLNKSINSQASVYTYKKVYIPPHYLTVTPTDEVLDRYIILSNLLGLSIDSQKTLLNNTLEFFYFSRNVPALENMNNKDWEEKMLRFKLNYIIVSPEEINLIHPSQHLQLDKSINGYLIYKYTQ